MSGQHYEEQMEMVEKLSEELGEKETILMEQEEKIRKLENKVAGLTELSIRLIEEGDCDEILIGWGIGGRTIDEIQDVIKGWNENSGEGQQLYWEDGKICKRTQECNICDCPCGEDGNPLTLLENNWEYICKNCDEELGVCCNPECDRKLDKYGGHNPYPLWEERFMATKCCDVCNELVIAHRIGMR